MSYLNCEDGEVKQMAMDSEQMDPSADERERPGDPFEQWQVWLKAPRDAKNKVVTMLRDEGRRLIRDPDKRGRAAVYGETAALLGARTKQQLRKSFRAWKRHSATHRGEVRRAVNDFAKQEREAGRDVEADTAFLAREVLYDMHTRHAAEES